MTIGRLKVEPHTETLELISKAALHMCLIELKQVWMDCALGLQGLIELYFIQNVKVIATFWRCKVLSKRFINCLFLCSRYTIYK